MPRSVLGVKYALMFVLRMFFASMRRKRNLLLPIQKIAVLVGYVNGFAQ
jgi:hypothetical protein